jgi:peptidoglycan/xylan/chitin deacetylase (PgdA/CDA1 family)
LVFVKLILVYGFALAATIAAILALLFYFHMFSFPIMLTDDLLPGLNPGDNNSGQNGDEIVSPLPPNNGSKAVIITFDDGWASQYTTAKPILDRFGFKATFFIVCSHQGYASYMSWEEVKKLYSEGYDVQSHSMTHRDLVHLSMSDLDYEIAQSKQCLLEQGISANIFATPYNSARNNATVINTIAKYYDLAKNGNEQVMYLYCDGWSASIDRNQTDCRTFDENGSLNFANRYSIRAWNHNYYDATLDHDESEVFAKFVQEVNANYYDTTGGLKEAARRIPIIEYHRVDDAGTATSTSPSLFIAEMQYLYDNGFVVLTMSDLRYNNDTNSLKVSLPDQAQSQISARLNLTQDAG